MYNFGEIANHKMLDKGTEVRYDVPQHGISQGL